MLGGMTIPDIIVQNQPVCKPADFFFYRWFRFQTVSNKLFME